MSVIYNYVKKHIGTGFFKLRVRVARYRERFVVKRMTMTKWNKSKSTFSPRSNFNPSQYSNKIMLAPMVRIGTLPTRLLCLRMQADLVYTEELIDRDLLRTKRVVNEERKTIDFVDESDGEVLFRTCEEERDKVILQIASSDPNLALKASRLVQNDVAGIDINMGCPKAYSSKAGTGASLLKKPDKIQAILTTLVSNLNVPVTCKIRVRPSLEKTLSLCEMIESCGVSAIGVHGRTRMDDKDGPCRTEFVKAISQRLNIPVIANGGSNEINCYEDIRKFQEETNCSSAMIARAVQVNPSIFRKEGNLAIRELVPILLKLSIDYENVFTGAHSKYLVQNMLKRQKKLNVKEKTSSECNIQLLCKLWNLHDYYNEVLEKHKKNKENSLIVSKLPDGDFPGLSPSSTITIVSNCKLTHEYYQKKFSSYRTPRGILYEWLNSQDKNEGSNSEVKVPIRPLVTSQTRQRRVRSLVSIDNGSTWFGTNNWETTSRRAEEAACLALVKHLQIQSPAS